jgi:CDP-glucose 4,6-dehydratase
MINKMDKLFNNVFENKTVLVTGNTGFKGSWLTSWLNELGAKVIGVSVDIPTNPSMYESANISDFVHQEYVDIRNIDEIRKIVVDVQPDFVFHLAAQAIVRASYDNPLETITTNAIGSANILESLRGLDKKVVAVIITSDKVYDNVEWPWGYKETDRLGGKDPYSASKGMAELVVRSYLESYFNNPNSNIRLGVTRAGNVIGGGDWAQDRIVVDCIKSCSKNQPVAIRNPNATRPWQHVLEPLSGYLLFASSLHESDRYHGQAYNFGPSSSQNYPVKDLIREMAKNWDQIYWNDNFESSNEPHEAGLLKLNCDKALFDLNWLPVLKFEETVEMTVEWYKEYDQKKGISMLDFSSKQIKQYIEYAKFRKIKWSNHD